MSTTQAPAKRDMTPRKATSAPTPTTPAEPPNTTATAAQNFTKRIEKQFEGELGQGVQWSPVQQRLAQHLFIKIDGQLRALETKRAASQRKANDPPITWANVNMHKLTLDAVHRVNLGLDALIANHIHVIPYLNSRTKQYDIDLQIGYTGLDHCHRTFAAVTPIDITYQLVYEGDRFAIDRSAGWEQPVYEPVDYFKPGPVVGGYGYIQYEDTRKNRVIVVPYREFEKAMKGRGMKNLDDPDGARTGSGVEFWGGIQTEWKNGKLVEGDFDEKFFNEMCYKTVVKRVVAKIPLDPEKVNASSWNAVEESHRDAIEAEISEEVAEYGNKEPLALGASSNQVGVPEGKPDDDQVAVTGAAQSTITEQLIDDTADDEEDPGF